MSHRCRCQCMLAAVLLLMSLLPACSRRDYRMRADRDAMGLLHCFSDGTPWQPASVYDVYPDPDSRLADPTNADCPELPPPGPFLYGEPSSDDAEEIDTPEQQLPDPLPEELPVLHRLPSSAARPTHDTVRLVTFESAGELRRIALLDEPANAAPIDEASPPAGETPVRPSGSRTLQPIPDLYWRTIPSRCLDRMLEFESVREEYLKTPGNQLAAQPQEAGERLTLREVVDLARRNSRDYQTQKENLYIAALALSLERFDYQLRFSNFGNGTDVDYLHNRSDGVTVNRLNLASGFQVERLLATGGNFLARFANDVLLTFNGPDGFTSDVASELLFDVTQSVLQRDVLLDPLIQSERDLVYAARDFARYRKIFFFDLASRYYDILRTYRAIEIESQNYLSLVRTVEQARAEVLAGVQSAPNQVAVDQFEQSMLGGRSDLIEITNGLERALDNLKLTIGLPTDYPINVDLEELDQLTLLDEVEVAFVRVERWRRRLEDAKSSSLPDRTELLNASVFLSERLTQWMQLSKRLNEDQEVSPELTDLIQYFSVERAYEELQLAEAELRRTVDAEVPQPIILRCRRTLDAIGAHEEYTRSQLEQLSSRGTDVPAELLQRLEEASRRFQQTQNRLAGILQADLADLYQQTQLLVTDYRAINQQLEAARQVDRQRTDRELLEETLAATDRLSSLANELQASAQHGLPEVDIDVNDAMVTALVQRLDLMNERGLMADDWRRVKFAADDLRSVLNLGATQRIRTDRNTPFDFDLDDSTTQLRLTLDLPLNRRQQRNRYRRSLIDYQRGRRSVMQLEDQIKFEIRDGVRTLDQIRVQYPISVTQAALAAEQVISTQLQLELGVPEVRETDLLDALQRSRLALREVANSRISYLVRRAEFVLDLELMQLDERAFWPQINDPNYQPVADTLYPRNAGPTYGRLSPCVKPSKLMYHLYRHRLPGDETVTYVAPQEN